MTIERSAGVFADYSAWPIPDVEKVKLRIQDTGPTTAGLLKTGPKRRPASRRSTRRSWTARTQSQNTMQTNPDDGDGEPAGVPDAAAAPDVRISGTPVVSLSASADQIDTNARRAPRRLGRRHAGAVERGRRHPHADDRGLLGRDSADDDACYFQTETRTVTAEIERVTKGILDARNRNSLTTPEDLVPGQ